MELTLPDVFHGGRFAGDRTVQPHSHPGVELVLVTRGSCRTRVGDVWLEGETGALFVLPARVTQTQEGLVHTTYVTFSPLPGFFDDTARIIQLSADDPAQIWLEQLVDLLHSPLPGQDDLRRALLLTILLRLKLLEQRNREVAHLHPGVAAALAILEKEYACPTPLRTEDLARRVGLSASHLSALFRQAMNCSLLDWLLRLRLRQAESLLPDHRLRIKEVAAACGFTDLNYFVRRFRRHYGVSPGHWRAGRRVNSRLETD